jgi:hypothetical protein
MLHLFFMKSGMSNVLKSSISSRYARCEFPIQHLVSAVLIFGLPVTCLIEATRKSASFRYVSFSLIPYVSSDPLSSLRYFYQGT